MCVEYLRDLHYIQSRYNNCIILLIHFYFYTHQHLVNISYLFCLCAMPKLIQNMGTLSRNIK